MVGQDRAEKGLDIRNHEIEVLVVAKKGDVRHYAKDEKALALPRLILKQAMEGGPDREVKEDGPR